MIRKDMQLLHRPDAERHRWLPESVWVNELDADRRVVWAAIQHGKDSPCGSVNCYNPRVGLNTTFELAGRPGFVRPTTDGTRVVVGMENDIGVLDFHGFRFTPFASTPKYENRRVRINDGAVLPNGAGLVFGTNDTEFNLPIGAFYLYYRGEVTILKVGETCPNGNVFIEQDGQLLLLHIDTKEKTILSGPLDLDSRTYSPNRTVVKFGDTDSFPDGMFGPVPGLNGPSVIVAMFDPIGTGPGEVRQYSVTTGELERIWLTPHSPQVTCPTLAVYPDGVYLIVTTAAENMPADRVAVCKNAGCLFMDKTNFLPTQFPDQARLKI